MRRDEALEARDTPFAEHTIETLRWMTRTLDALSIPYQISGGFAAKLYGSPRPLNDIDFDIPDDAFPLIEPHLRPHLVYGPDRYIDEKWDILLMTADYAGQEIDVSGGTTGRMTSKGDVAWMESPSDFESTIRMTLEDMSLQVIPPRALAAYKWHLNGDHQRADIEAALRYADAYAL